MAAAGGDEQAVKDGFLKSAGAVLIQGGSDKLEAFSPKAKDAYDTVQCISARDVDCLSNTTWARDATGKFLYDDEDGKPIIDPDELDPKQSIGRWTGLDLESAEVKKNAFITQISKLPNMEAIPILKNQWVLTWTLGKEQDIAYKKPTVALTYVGNDAPFNSTVEYGGVANSPVAPNDASGDGGKSIARNDKITLWRQNDSILSMSLKEDHVEIRYKEPTDFIKSTGVEIDDLKFEGRKIGLNYTGTAYIHTEYCDEGFAYQMSGTEGIDHKTLTLDGASPALTQIRVRSSISKEVLVHILNSRELLI